MEVPDRLGEQAAIKAMRDVLCVAQGRRRFGFWSGVLVEDGAEQSLAFPLFFLSRLIPLKLSSLL